MCCAFVVVFFFFSNLLNWSQRVDNNAKITGLIAEHNWEPCSENSGS